MVARYARIAGVLVAIPERDGEPRAARRPEPPLRAVDRGRRAPEIRVVVGDPATGAIHLAGRACARHGEVLNHGGQRVHRLLQVRGHRRPVVHLGVDVDRVLAAPRRRQAVVPDALQIGGLRAGARAGDEQVARVLEVQRGECGVATGRECGDALIGGKGNTRGRAEIERDAVEELPVIADVRGAQRFDGLAGRATQRGGH